MTGRGNIQKQLSHVLSLINAEGYNLEEVMPQEMQDHFTDMAALKEAKAYIKEIEAREKQLQAENADLSAKLSLKQAEIDDQPEEFKALQVDLAQAQRHIDYYKKLADDAQDHAERYERKMREAVKGQATADDEGRKIQRLERELADYAAATFKLLEQNRAMAEHRDTQQEREQAFIDEKNAQIADLINHANMLEVEKLEAVELSEKVSETYDSLIQNLEEETLTAAEVLNRHSVSLIEMVKSNDQLYSAVASEMAPLKSFFDHAYNTMAIYQEVFQSLADPNCGSIESLPQALDLTLDAANEDILRFQLISVALQDDGTAQEKVRGQVSDLAQIAARMYITLEGIKDDISDFLNRLQSDANAWLSLKGLDTTPHAGLSRCATPTPSIASSTRSSVSSFMSMAKHLSFASPVDSIHVQEL
ncbi:hypothetical protein EK21DRAFT_57209 [Setomelanomma holmii]|uniref:Uncharacterized protein n=1 Tax=Setomelanomma holmii TaxID=210430 RepID=A0A9P4HI82_9PLEO|nr:hypothetical protein EK21DRAFT_57209 [Setomelanomma holmii]